MKRIFLIARCLCWQLWLCDSCFTFYFNPGVNLQKKLQMMWSTTSCHKYKLLCRMENYRLTILMCSVKKVCYQCWKMKSDIYFNVLASLNSKHYMIWLLKYTVLSENYYQFWICEKDYTIFTWLIEPISICDRAWKEWAPFLYDNFILANYLILDNKNIIVVF